VCGGGDIIFPRSFGKTKLSHMGILESLLASLDKYCDAGIGRGSKIRLAVIMPKGGY